MLQRDDKPSSTVYSNIGSNFLTLSSFIEPRDGLDKVPRAGRVELDSGASRHGEELGGKRAVGRSLRLRNIRDYIVGERGNVERGLEEWPVCLLRCWG